MEQIVCGQMELAGSIQASAEAESHLKAMVGYAGKRLGAKERARFWKELAEADCFAPACVEGAKGALEESGVSSGTDAERAEYRAALKDYLGAATKYEKTAKSLFPPG